MKNMKFLVASALTATILLTGACNSEPQKMAAAAAPQGFSNIKDTPIPDTATVDTNRSMVVGGGDSWTGKLVYATPQPAPEVIDFVTAKMQASGWTKISELRGTENVFSFMKQKRVATVVVKGDSGYLANGTEVSVGMVNSHSRISEAAPAVQVDSVVEKAS